MALDEPKETDSKAEEKGYNFCIDGELLTKLAHVTVDYNYMGFSVDSEIPVSSGGGSCGGCSSSGGCGSN